MEEPSRQSAHEVCVVSDARVQKDKVACWMRNILIQHRNSFLSSVWFICTNLPEMVIGELLEMTQKITELRKKITFRWIG